MCFEMGYWTIDELHRQLAEMRVVLNFGQFLKELHGGRVIPYFVASGSMSLEYKSETLEPFDGFSVPESGKIAHYVASRSG